MTDYLAPRANPYLPDLPDVNQIAALLQSDAPARQTGALYAQASAPTSSDSGSGTLALLSAIQGQKSSGSGSRRKKKDGPGGGGPGKSHDIGAKGLPNRPNALQLAKWGADKANVPEKWARDKRSWYILSHESGLSKNDPYHGVVQAAHNANPTSSAYGIGQFLDATWHGYPGGKTSDPKQQMIDYFMYLKRHWGGLEPAYRHKVATGWY